MSDISREDALAHFGVKGMKWGVRKDDKGGSSGSSEPSRREKRRQANEDIRQARLRQQTRAAEANRIAMTTYTATTDKGRKAAERKWEKAIDEIANGPDAATAARMTTGEKWATGLQLTGIGLAAISLGASAVKRNL